MNTISPSLGEHDFSPLQWPTGRWSLLCVRAWVLGMAIHQVPEYTLGNPLTSPTLPDLPIPDKGVTGQTKFQLELQAAIIKREWDLQAQAPEKAWTMGYRQEYQQAWLPVHLGAPGTTKTVSKTDAKADTPEIPTTPLPDLLAILCPSHAVGQMCEQAASLLVLRPGYVYQKDGQEKIHLLREPCLTIVRGFLAIEAHLLLEDPSVFTFPKSDDLSQGGAVQKIRSACLMVNSEIKKASYLLPMLTDPLAASSLPY